MHMVGWMTVRQSDRQAHCIFLYLELAKEQQLKVEQLKVEKERSG